MSATMEWAVGPSGDKINATAFVGIAPRLREQVTCLCCEEVVTPKAGDEKTPHYAHRPGSSCALTNPETAAHFNAKMHVAAMLGACSVVRVLGRCPGGHSHALEWDLPYGHSVEVERAVGSRRPDVLVTVDGAPWLAVEVLHTHAVDDEKASDLDATVVDWFEVRALDALAWNGASRLATTRVCATAQALASWQCKHCVTEENAARRVREAIQRGREAEQRAREEAQASVDAARQARAQQADAEAYEARCAEADVRAAASQAYRAQARGGWDQALAWINADILRAREEEAREWEKKAEGRLAWNVKRLADEAGETHKILQRLSRHIPWHIAVGCATRKTGQSVGCIWSMVDGRTPYFVTVEETTPHLAPWYAIDFALTMVAEKGARPVVLHTTQPEPCVANVSTSPWATIEVVNRVRRAVAETDSLIVWTKPEDPDLGQWMRKARDRARAKLREVAP